MLFKTIRILKLSLLSKPINYSCVCGVHKLVAKELKLVEYGNADQCVQVHTSELDTTRLVKQDGHVLVKLVAAPINPADLNIIQGKYGVLPERLPATIGNEGLFEVVDVGGGGGSLLEKGDLVLPLGQSTWGAWRSHAVEAERVFFKIASRLDDDLRTKYRELATITVNPPTAWCMLKNFVDLKPGDTVIQNGANSGVGQAVIQLAKAFKINVVNIVRKRDNQDELNSFLKDLGAQHIFVEEDLRKSVVLTRDLWHQIPKPRLALNCVGGKTTTDMLRLVDRDATMVTYGGMSRQPVIINTADFIFKNLKSVGFWLTVWKRDHFDDYTRTLHALLELIRANEFRAPRCDEFKLEQFGEAFKRVQTPFHNSKVLFVS